MQDPTLFPQLQPQFQEHEQLPCPRCNSTNTKFCYYNNYNLSQPRHFCKNCRRYWTKGGALRNVPVGGGCRKTTKRATKRHHPPPPIPTKSSEFCAAPSSSTAQTSPTQNPILNHGPGTLSGSGPTREPLPGLGPNRFLGVPAGSFTLPSSSATTKSLGFCSAPSRSPVQISPTHYPNLNHEPGLASGSGPNRLLGTPTVSFTHPSSATTSPSQISPTQNRIPNREPDSVSGSGPNQVLGVSARGFTSLLVSNGQFGSLLDGLNPDGSGGEPGRVQKYAIPGSSPGSGHGLGQELGSDPNPRVDSSSCWGSSNGWPDLAIYTPGFH